MPSPRQPAQAPSSVQERLTIEVSEMRRNWYRTASNALVIAGEFENTTGLTQESPKVTISLYDASDRIIDTKETTGVPKVVPSSGKGYFSVNTGFQPNTVAYAAVTVSFLTASDKPATQRNITEWATGRLVDDRDLSLNGVFTNTLKVPMYGPRVAVVIRDGFGKVVWVEEYVSPSWVIPDEQARWSLTLSSAPEEVVDHADTFEAILVFR